MTERQVITTDQTSLTGTDQDASVVLQREETAVPVENSSVRPGDHISSHLPMPGIRPVSAMVRH